MFISNQHCQLEHGPNALGIRRREFPRRDHFLELTVHRGMAGPSESFSNLDFADDVALLAEMLSLLVLALEIMDEEARPLDLTVNWSKTKIQTMLDPAPAGNQVTINGHSVEVVE